MPTTGRPPGSKTQNRSEGVRPGPRGPRQPRPPNLGPPVRTSPWAALGSSSLSATGAAAAAGSSSSSTTVPGSSSSSTAAGHNGDLRSLESLPAPPVGDGPSAESLPSPATISQSPPAVEATGDGTTTAAAAAASIPRSADGRFGRSTQYTAEGGVQSKFRDLVKREVESRVRRKGHGSKQDITGSLLRGSTWFFPDDPQKSPVPDRDVHLMTAIYLVCWEFYDDDIKAPPCPFCESSENVVSDGWCPKTRLVHGEDFNYELLGFQHKCNTCAGKEKGNKAKGAESRCKFAAWHPDVLRQLPRDLLEAFPALILPYSAVDRRLVTRIEQTMETKGGLQTLANHIEEAHKVEFHQRELRWTFRMGRKRRAGQTSLVAADNETLQRPPRFGGFSDKNGYRGNPPSASVLRVAWYEVFEARKPWYRRSGQLVDGENLALDDSHKLVKGIKLNDCKVFHGLLTIMNEHNQVIAQAAKQSVTVDSHEEARSLLLGVARRYLTLGFSKIKVVFTDNCCSDRPIVQETLGPAAVADPGGVTPVPAAAGASPLPYLAFPDQTKPTVIVVSSENCAHSALACTQLLSYARESARSIRGHQVVLGFDCEWTPSLGGRGKVAVIQVSSLCGYTVIFQVKTQRGCEAGVMPRALKELMENDKVQLAGVAVGGDITRVKADYGVDGTGAVDVGVLAGKHLGVAVRNRSLAALAANLLGRHLAKGAVRVGDWERTPLSDEQVHYAGSDAFASVLLHRHIIERADPVFFTPMPDSASLAAGTVVRLYTRTNTRCVAEGSVDIYPEGSTWGCTDLVIGRRQLTDRMVVNLALIHIPGALALYCGEDGGVTGSLFSVGLQATVLWDTRNVRLPPEPPPEHSIPGEGADGKVADLTPGEREGKGKALAPTRTEEAGGATPTNVPKPVVKLDLFHAKHRLIDCARKQHGAFPAFCGSLGDALAIGDPRAMEELRASVSRLHPTFDPLDVNRFLSQNYNTTIQPLVPKIVPPNLVAAERFDNVVDVFRDIADATTGDPFFTPRLTKAAINLRPHLLQGCLSDPDPDFFSPYYCTGRSAKYVLPTYRSTRGTNRVETYHTPLRSILGGHRASPRFASSVLVVYNHRRNHRMAVKHRGLPEDMKNFYHLWVIEDIQVEAANMFVDPIYPFWESTKNYEDTGEVVGFVSSSQEDASSSGNLVDYAEDGQDSDDHEEEGRGDVYGGGLTPSARTFAQMQGAKIGTRPYTPVQTEAEIRKFKHGALGYLHVTERPGRPPTQSINWERMTDDWNTVVDKEEELEQAGSFKPDKDNLINRKRPGDLQHYWVESRKTVNVKRTMEPVLEATANLRKSQRVDVEQPGFFSQGTDQGSSVGILQDGSRLVFPSGIDAAGVRPRPQPLLHRVGMPSDADGGGGGWSSDELDLVRVDVGEHDGGGIGALAMLGVGTAADGDGGSVGASQAVAQKIATPGSSFLVGMGVSRQKHVGGEAGGQALAANRRVGHKGGGAGPAAEAGGGEGVLGGGGQVAIGNPCHVMPIQACSTLRTIAPKFGIEEPSSVLLQPWNPLSQVEAPKPVLKPRAKPTCQTCGHLYTSGYFALSSLHTRGAEGRLECFVDRDAHRPPTFPNRAKGRFATCACHLCLQA